MLDIQKQRRLDILANPTETLKIECKKWLDLTDNHDKAVIAKAAIALANSGGGTIVIGIVEDETQAKHFHCVPRPENIKRYTNEAISDAINKYAEPALDVALRFEYHPETGNEYAFVEIPGGARQPVFSKKRFNGKINKLACYIRKPGPKSEVPHTAQEWSDLLHRCVVANREGLLDNIRTIIDGRPLDTSPSPSDDQDLIEFMAASKERWQKRLHDLKYDHVAHLRDGHWTFAFSILGAARCTSLNELRHHIDTAREADYGPFWEHYLHGPHPIPTDDGIEAWLANPAAKEYYDPRECCFWRVTLDGHFYYLDAFYEDAGFQGMTPGRFYDISNSIKRYGDMFMFAGRIARMLGEDAEVLMRSELMGVNGRLLSSERLWWLKARGYQCRVPTISLKPIRVTPQQIEENLVEVLHEFLHPLYERFSSQSPLSPFYDLNRQLVAVEIDLLRKRQW